MPVGHVVDEEELAHVSSIYDGKAHRVNISFPGRLALTMLSAFRADCSTIGIPAYKPNEPILGGYLWLLYT